MISVMLDPTSQKQVGEQGADYASNTKGNFAFDRVCDFNNKA